jgi:hypothetical protein
MISSRAILTPIEKGIMKNKKTSLKAIGNNNVWTKATMSGRFSYRKGQVQL